MMIKKTMRERGQALPLLALAVVGLIAFTALAIDGGLTYSDRRHAQNAADAAALAGAYAKVGGNDWSAAALGRASDNGFDDNDPGDNATDPDVEVYNPPISGPYAGDDEYIQVFIDSQVETSLIHFVYTGDVINSVEAVARAKPYEEMYFGNAVVALDPTGRKAMKYHGGPTIKVTGGGLWSNSSHSCGYSEDGGPSGSAPSVSIVANSPSCLGASPLGPVTSGEPQLDYPPPDYFFPDYTCDYNHNGISVSGHDELTLPAGVHCVNGDFKYNGGTLEGTGVTIVMVSGEVTLNGNGALDLSSPSTGPTAGLLFYLPMSNSGTVKVNGNSEQSMTGTVLAPASEIQINGTADTTAIRSQFIGRYIDFGGSMEGAIHYEDDDNYDTPPIIELVQ